MLGPERRVLFLDTVDASATETLSGETLSNGGEAALVLSVLHAAAAAGVAQERLGVISPYRAQVGGLDCCAVPRWATLCCVHPGPGYVG